MACHKGPLPSHSNIIKSSKNVKATREKLNFEWDHEARTWLSQAAASINISRTNSLEDVLSLPATAPNGLHSRLPSQDVEDPNPPGAAAPKGLAHSASAGHFLANRATAPRIGTSLPDSCTAAAELEGEPLAGLPVRSPSTTASGSPTPSSPGRPDSADRAHLASITRFGQEAAGNRAPPEEGRGTGVQSGVGLSKHGLSKLLSALPPLADLPSSATESPGKGCDDSVLIDGQPQEVLTPPPPPSPISLQSRLKLFLL
jgi:hypothetical protein